MDEEHLDLLGQIFWDMNQIDYTTETYTEEVTVEVPVEDSTDEDGVTEEVQIVERTRLVITISGNTAQQMTEEYGFDQEQLDLLNELLLRNMRICGLGSLATAMTSWRLL